MRIRGGTDRGADTRRQSCACKGSVKGEGENRLEGSRRPILLITALIWWETLTDLDGNNTLELPSLQLRRPPRKKGGDRGKTFP